MISKRFHGKPCKVCGGTERYVSYGGCTICTDRRARERRAGAKPLTDDQRRRIEALWTEGKTIKAIALQLGITIAASAYATRRLPAKTKKVTPERLAEARRLFADGVPYRDIMRLTRLNHRTIQAACDDLLPGRETVMNQRAQQRADEHARASIIMPMPREPVPLPEPPRRYFTPSDFIKAPTRQQLMAGR